MSKNTDRARAEKEFEDMMGDDWRVFRARLVAQERSESQEKSFQDPARLDVRDARQAKQDKLGDLFAGLASSIFKSKDDNGRSTSNNIFDGDAVGGATANSCLPGDEEESVDAVFEDPFVTETKRPMVRQTKSVNIDKHRWAHAIPHIEPGCVLIANEKLGGVFHQTVVLVIDHHEATGSTGIVINRPLGENLLKVASETESNVDLSLKLAFNTAPVSYGGPVMQEEYSILHGYGEVEGSKKVSPGVFVGGSQELMSEVRQNKFHPSNSLFVKGHAAWVPGQLTREISKGVWYTAAVSSDFVLRYAGAPVEDGDNSDDLWSDILSAMGSEYSEIAMQHAGRGDMRMMP